MKNQNSEKLIKLIISIALSIIGIAAVVLPLIFKESLTKFLNYFITILGAISLFVGLLLLYSVVKKEESRMNVKQMSMVGIMSAITVILYYFVKFNLPFFPPWLDIQVSELPALITGFLVIPIPHQHNILVLLTNIYKYFFVNRQRYYWKGWCVNYGEEETSSTK